ncbi:MAG: TetR/AcrR family transcriptional regulator [Solirubrobacteraceae bacterium]
MSTQRRWTGEPLPRGRHKLSRDEVLASQRGRLLRAMEELVGEFGYDSTTVPQVIKAARVSTATFYRFFVDKVDCFIALCEEQGERLLSALMPDQDELQSLGPSERLDRALEIYLHWWQDKPAMARAYFVELPAAGPRAIAERDRQYERFVSLNRVIADQARGPAAPSPPEIDVRASVMLTTELIASEIRRGNVGRLIDLRADLRRLLMKLLGPAGLDLEIVV